MITMILSTYRGANAPPSAIVDNSRLFRLILYNQRLFRVLNRAGVFNQQRIDTENPLDPIVREQYQRYPTMII